MAVAVTRRPRRKLSYYSFNLILSYFATFMFVVGARGLGKTFGIKRKSIKAALRAIKDGLCEDQFVYLRRYKEETTMAKDTFFADILEYFPDWAFRVNGRHAEARKANAKKDDPWIIIGYFSTLSQAQHAKGSSFHRVRTIIFDEFIIETVTPGYIRNEYKVFLNFYSTVDRWQDKTRVYFLANSISITNPYFLALKIRPDTDTDRNGIIRKRVDPDTGVPFAVAHFPDSAQFKSEVYNTTFGKFLAEEDDMASSMVENQFADNHDGMVGAKTSNASPLFNIETKLGTFSVWHDMMEGEYYIKPKPIPYGTMFTLDRVKMNKDKVFLESSSPLLKKMRTYFNTGRMTFTTVEARNAFVEVFK